MKAASLLCTRSDLEPSEVIFTDNGRGLYGMATSEVKPEYQEAVNKYKFPAVAVEDASVQPGNLQEGMLHVTAISWVRIRLRKTLPKSPWKETEPDYVKRLKAAATYFNENYNVTDLKLELPARVAADGGRIK